MREFADFNEKPLVLVVDDDETERILTREVLERAGLIVEEAEDGDDALSAFERLRPDIVLMDVVMPKMDGITACAMLRETSFGSHTPIVMVTGLDDLEAISRAYEAGATDFITKPIPWMVLQHRMRYMLRANWALGELSRSRTRLAEAQRIARLGNWEWDIKKNLIRWPEETSHIYGLCPEELGETYEGFLGRVHPDDRSMVKESIRQALNNVCPFRADHRILLPDGSERFVYQQAETLFNEKGQPVRMMGTIQDVTERKRAEQQITYLAYHDTLTGLPNRVFFKERLRQALSHAERHGEMMAVLFLDLDRFKRINDTLGHDAGDLLLQKVAELIVGSVRCSDEVGRPDREDGDYAVTRLGGDEFTILLSGITRSEDVARVTQRMLDTLSAPVRVKDQEVFVTASIGIAIFPSDGKDMDALLKNADTAMYHAKERGRNNYQFYTESMNSAALERFSMENDLRRAVEEHQFILYYQPEMDVQSGRIVAAEALLRWLHPLKGILFPEAFLPVACEMGLILPIGSWVLHTACAQARAWQDAGFPVRVNVNLSSRQLDQADLATTVSRAVERSQLNPGFLGLEIREDISPENEKSTTVSMHRLKSLGARLIVDNFGIGYSSLSYLKRFPIDSIKIDRSFVGEIPYDPDSTAITAAIITMARSLRLESIAEGVETEEQKEFFSNQGCSSIQGDVISPPLTQDEFAEFLRRMRRLGCCGNPGRKNLLFSKHYSRYMAIRNMT